jgi:hypothetical protein
MKVQEEVADKSLAGNDNKSLIADHGMAPYYPLDICYCPRDVKDIREMYAASKRIIDLNYRTQFKQCRMGDSHKRKREALADEEYPDDMVAYDPK